MSINSILYLAVLQQIYLQFSLDFYIDLYAAFRDFVDVVILIIYMIFDIVPFNCDENCT